MKLFLSSYRLGSDPGVLADLVGRNGRALIVTNALDQWADGRRRTFPREVEDLRAIGFASEELDLRKYFTSPEGLAERLAAADLVWTLGGNTFVLARAMRRSGFDRAASALVRANQLVYAGYSAGSCVVTPDLQGCHLMDEPEVLPVGYDSEDDASPLGWVPWRIVPHFRSDHDEAELAQCAVDYLLSAGLAFRTLRDGQAIVVEDDGSRIVGDGPDITDR